MDRKLTLNIKVTMLVGVLLYAIATLVAYAFYANQRKVAEIITHLSVSEVFPYALRYMIAYLIIYVFFTVVMFITKPSARRGAGAWMLVFYCIIHIIIPITDRLILISTANKYPSDVYAAIVNMDSIISFSTAPLIVVSSVLIVVSIGRFGISGTKKEDEADQEPVIFTEDKEDDNGGFVKY
ncbi:MAG: hypothetical protein K5871_10260 [Lachnospiraceae bacterium]|nr:hypothetical protein [Lachnospiraceae bacterium]